MGFGLGFGFEWREAGGLVCVEALLHLGKVVGGQIELLEGQPRGGVALGAVHAQQRVQHQLEPAWLGLRLGLIRG